MTLRPFLKFAAVGVVAMLLFVSAVVVWNWQVVWPRQLEGFIDAHLAELDGDIPLVTEPVTLGATPLRLSSAEPLVVMPRSSVCATLTDTVDRADDEDAQFEMLMAGARLDAVFHFQGGRSHAVSDAHWMFRGSGRGKMFACVDLRCPCKPDAWPFDGTIVEAIDLRSSQALRVRSIVWSHPGYTDPKRPAGLADAAPSQAP